MESFKVDLFWMERARKVTFSWELSLKKDPSCIAHNTSCVTSLKIKPVAEATSHYYSKPENF